VKELVLVSRRTRGGAKRRLCGGERIGEK